MMRRKIAQVNVCVLLPEPERLHPERSVESRMLRCCERGVCRTYTDYGLRVRGRGSVEEHGHRGDTVGIGRRMRRAYLATTVLDRHCLAAAAKRRLWNYVSGGPRSSAAGPWLHDVRIRCGAMPAGALPSVVVLPEDTRGTTLPPSPPPPKERSRGASGGGGGERGEPEIAGTHETWPPRRRIARRAHTRTRTTRAPLLI